jgi:hypothetical protein
LLKKPPGDGQFTRTLSAPRISPPNVEIEHAALFVVIDRRRVGRHVGAGIVAISAIPIIEPILITAGFWPAWWCRTDA